LPAGVGLLYASLEFAAKFVLLPPVDDWLMGFLQPLFTLSLLLLTPLLLTTRIRDYWGGCLDRYLIGAAVERPSSTLS